MSDRNTTQNQKRLILIILLYFTGVIAGAVLFCFPPDGQAGRFDAIADSFISGRYDKNFAEILVNAFCEPFVMLLICFFLGFSAVAHPAEYIVPVFHALGTGITLAGIYDMYGVNGIGMSAVMIIPGTVISAFAVIIAVRESLNMSTDVYSAVFGKNPVSVRINFRLYFTKYMILCVMIVFAALAESVAVILFSDIWKG